MEYDGEAGLFLSLKDCTILFPALKGNESSLSREERMLMLRIEKVLYGNLSIREMEELLGEAAGGLKPPPSDPEDPHA